jgi:hypothetical protein
LCPVLLLFLFAACTQTVEVTIDAPSSGWEVYGVDTVRVTCHPARYVSYVELLIDSAVVAVDTYPDPTYRLPWDVTQLREAGVHRVQARAISGSREYLSTELLATVGYRSRLALSGTDDRILIYRPDGFLEATMTPVRGINSAHARLTPGCNSVVFIANHKLYRAAVRSDSAQLLSEIENGIYSCDASPTSDRVVFEGYPAANAHLFTVDSLGNATQLTHDGDAVLIDSSLFTCTSNSNPVFSPDGQRIAYYRTSVCLVSGDPHEHETRENLFLMNANGSGLANLASGLGNVGGYTWTFDGRWLLYPDPEEPEIPAYAVNMSGHEVAVRGFSSSGMMCSPLDSSMIFVGSASTGLCQVRLAWTEDTLYVNGVPDTLAAGSFGRYLDWVRYEQ